MHWLQFNRSIFKLKKQQQKIHKFQNDLFSHAFELWSSMAINCNQYPNDRNVVVLRLIVLIIWLVPIRHRSLRVFPAIHHCRHPTRLSNQALALLHKQIPASFIRTMIRRHHRVDPHSTNSFPARRQPNRVRFTVAVVGSRIASVNSNVAFTFIP